MGSGRQPAVKALCGFAALLCLLFLSDASAGHPGRSQPVISIIIDDLGNNLRRGEMMLQLPGAITYSFLPHTPYADLLAEMAHLDGREVMVHLPMASFSEESLGPGGLTLEMSEPVFMRTFMESIASIPHAAGLNNHMGSLLTSLPVVMDRLMRGISQLGNLYFIDSRTTSSSVGEQVAGEHAVPHASRDVFLDNEREPEAIRRQLMALFAKARKEGHAIGIGHPYPETALVLQQELARLPDLGITLIPVSSMVDHQERKRAWQASSSHSPKVVKSSKR